MEEILMIKHIKCDIFESGADVILHQVNCQGVMGSGIAKTVKEKFPNVYQNYKYLCDVVTEPKNLLGHVQPCAIDVETEKEFCVVIFNLFAQENYGYDGKCYTDYVALRKCIELVKEVCAEDDVVAFPYLMGCHRGGGDWSIVHKMIEEVFADSDCEVLICEYNGG
jgi:hypothetical protein